MTSRPGKTAMTFALIAATVLIGMTFVMSDDAYAGTSSGVVIVQGFDDRFVAPRPFLRPFFNPFLNPFLFDDDFFFDDDDFFFDDDDFFFERDERPFFRRFERDDDERPFFRRFERDDD